MESKTLHKGWVGRPKDVRTVENVEKVRKILDSSNVRKSIIKISSNTGISRTASRKIRKEVLKKFPFKPTVNKKISYV